jgi:hypothetical protein
MNKFSQFRNDSKPQTLKYDFSVFTLKYNLVHIHKNNIDWGCFIGKFWGEYYDLGVWK